MTDPLAKLHELRFSESQIRDALALARAIVPAAPRVPAAGLRTVAAAAETAADMAGGRAALFAYGVEALDWAAVAFTGHRFHTLDADAQDALIQRWTDHPLLRWPLFVIGSLIESVHFDHQDAFAPWGLEHRKGGPPEPVRWLRQVVSGEDQADADPLECDVVVVGTGAGGAVVGSELADRGHAVVFLEEGKLYRRDSFNGSVLHAHHRFYRNQAKVVSWGNTMVPVLMGRLVGGSTAINTGTSFRTPPWILNEWCERIGTDALSPEAMAPHFDRVEQYLQIGPMDDKRIGPIGPVVARGCAALGWSHGRVPRNAPDCDEQSSCDFGCPSGGRRSMDLTYLPRAMGRGAMIVTDARANRILIENGRAVGVEARTTETGRTVRVRARAVIVAGGAVPTPLLLLSQGIANRSGQVGRNLSLHPGAAVSAWFDDVIEGFRHVPQSIYVDQFHRQGILLVGAQSPISIAPNLFQFHGRRLSEVISTYDHIATLGVLVKDSDPNGRVRVGPDGEPLITYRMVEADLQRTHRAVMHLLELFHAAGARRYYVLGHRMPTLETREDIERFRKRRPGPTDYLWTAFHPLGTVRMGTDPRTSVVGLDHECHDVPGLFVVDGSTVPGPTAVNPQLTIMAMADRAAGLIAAKL
jgi:choline dehydrogenase-like flavoprotein